MAPDRRSRWTGSPFWGSVIWSTAGRGRCPAERRNASRSGRALLSDPAFLLLDEPLASLDLPRREEIMRAIEHIRDVLALPILMVTHDPAEAARIGTRVVTMAR